MKKLFKKAAVIGMAGILTLSAAACGSSDESADDGKVAITIFNSKTEIQEYLEEAAATYGDQNNVDIEVYYSNDTVAAHLSSKYAASDPYTIAMTDAKDIYNLASEYCTDLSDQPWVSDTDYAISVDGKVVGFPVCVEARGLLYNADAIEAVTGEPFDPSTIQTLDDLTAMCDRLVAGGMEAPTAILKPDWSLGAHYIQQVYEEREDVDGFVNSLFEGTADLANDAKYNAIMDTFDVLKKYNKFKDMAVSVEDEQVHQALSEGEVAFQFGGSWEWNDIIDYDYTGNVGIMPLPQDIQDAYTGCIVGGGSKFFYIDSSEYTTDEQREAAKGFLNWIVDSDEGKTLISDTCGMVSPFKSNTVPCTNALGAMVKEYADAGKMVPNYDFDPDDHLSVVGAHMQEYLADKIDRTQLATDIEEYWKNATPIAH